MNFTKPNNRSVISKFSPHHGLFIGKVGKTKKIKCCLTLCPFVAHLLVIYILPTGKG